jgi:uncharacterized repeat protein (TIGR01451 family)
VPNGAPNPVQDTSPRTDGGSAVSPTIHVHRVAGVHDHEVDRLDSSTVLHPGDAITYTMTVQNTGTGVVTNAVVSDTLPRR